MVIEIAFTAIGSGRKILGRIVSLTGPAASTYQ
jgi:hypothetical protein